MRLLGDPVTSIQSIKFFSVIFENISSVFRTQPFDAFNRSLEIIHRFTRFRVHRRARSRRLRAEQAMLRSHHLKQQLKRLLPTRIQATAMP